MSGGPRRLLVDASVAVKWVVGEPGAADATLLRAAFGFVAPDLITAECINILWKKVRNGELSPSEAELAANMLAKSGWDLRSAAPYMSSALRLSIALDHPAYDCLYLVMAAAEGFELVTADERLLRKVAASGDVWVRTTTISLASAAAHLRPGFKPKETE